MNKPVTVAIAGLGSRGKDTYASLEKKLQDKMKIVAIADIDRNKVNLVAKEHKLPSDMCYNSAEEMLAAGKLADVILIATQDRQHIRHAVPALKLGYDLLMEKPISPSLDECREIMRVASEEKHKVCICHVLRYTPFFSKVKQLISDGVIGDVVTVMAIECVGYWHQAHSFVRGNWRDSTETSPMILQKCCHDMDLYLWLCNKKCKSVSSFGSTYLFKPEKAPEGSAEYCMKGCKAKDGCPYDAEKIYVTNALTGAKQGKTSWPLDVVALQPSVESVYAAIEDGPYGRCVYHCDNNVVDHQVVNLNMTDGSTMSFTMSGLTEENTRYARIMGTKAELICDMHANTIKVMPFGGTAEIIDVSKLANNFTGHAGGDLVLVEEFLDFVSGNPASHSITSLEQSIESHYVAFAAEESRLADGAPVSLDKFRNITN